MCQIKIINLINIFLFLKYDDIKLKCNYSMYVYCVMCDWKSHITCTHVSYVIYDWQSSDKVDSGENFKLDHVISNKNWNSLHLLAHFEQKMQITLSFVIMYFWFILTFSIFKKILWKKQRYHSAGYRTQDHSIAGRMLYHLSYGGST